MAPGAIILGRVTVGQQVYIGAGAIIKEGCRIADKATIGAGAVVINDIPEHATVVGVPAERYL
jgi:serine acetyltransferase